MLRRLRCPVPALTVDYFGGRNASGIIGILYTAAAVGTFLGPKLAGDAFDMFGTYTIPIALGAVFALVAVVLVILAPEPHGWNLGPPNMTKG